jgi:hypothetical protein
MIERDLSPPEHEHSAIVDQAVEWYSTNYANCERPIVPALQQRFGISALQAIVVIRETTMRRARAA